MKNSEKIVKITKNEKVDLENLGKSRVLEGDFGNKMSDLWEDILSEF